MLYLAEGSAIEADALAAARTNTAAASVAEPEVPDKPILECKSLSYTVLHACPCACPNAHLTMHTNSKITVNHKDLFENVNDDQKVYDSVTRASDILEQSPLDSPARGTYTGR